MDMMEMMDDQDGQDLSFFLASLFLRWMSLDLRIRLSLYGTIRRGTPVRCSQQQSVPCAVDVFYVSALQQ